MQVFDAAMRMAEGGWLFCMLRLDGDDTVDTCPGVQSDVTEIIMVMVISFSLEAVAMIGERLENPFKGYLGFCEPLITTQMHDTMLSFEHGRPRHPSAPMDEEDTKQKADEPKKRGQKKGREIKKL